MTYHIHYENKQGRLYTYAFTDKDSALTKCARLAKNPNAFRINCFPFEWNGGTTTYYGSIYNL